MVCNYAINDAVLFRLQGATGRAARSEKSNASLSSGKSISWAERAPQRPSAPMRTFVFSCTDQLHQLLRVHLMTVRVTSMLL